MSKATVHISNVLELHLTQAGDVVGLLQEIFL